MTHKSTAIISKDARWFVARSLEFGVVSQGKTIDEAKKNLQEAAELYLEDAPRIKRSFSKRAPLVTSIEVRG